jgi:diaminohydroxyphosphoribosylaminopyrimidine deaminase/5-amino-6-(5-phosphoribosylamino)uracil reductase
MSLPIPETVSDDDVSSLLSDAGSQDHTFSKIALDQAAKGIGLVSPNPLVGCMIVSAKGDVVGSAFYTFDGVTHAEMRALEQAGELARGGTAYVSLEPHSHHGKTPPCTEALIDAGIKRVVAPIDDPNPLVSGRGFARLREAGLEVTTGVLAKEAQRLNEKFICWHKNKRPFIHLKLAMSLDGRIALGESVSTLLSGDAARDRVQCLRHEYDAILVGANTAVVDDPSLTDRSGKPRRRTLVRVILDDRLRIDTTSKLVTTANEIPTMIFTTRDHPDKVADLRSSGVNVVENANGSRDLTTVLSELANHDIQSVLVEGGSQVAGAFIDSGHVDKVTFLMSPLILGGKGAPPAIGGQGARSIEKAVRLTDITVERLGDDIEITGYPVVSTRANDKGNTTET